ncbi:MAG: VOC family protein [Lachnospiraceae bacterium]|nr:VOC family protein [Lachnospiraceae bacterium]
MIKGFAHVALYTEQFEKTITFYKEAFGAEELGYFTTDRRGAWLGIGDSILEIFESERMPEGSFKHIALSCDNVDETYSKALLHGATKHVEPKNIELSLYEPRSLRIAFVKGINGEQIEFCEER